MARAFRPDAGGLHNAETANALAPADIAADEDVVYDPTGPADPLLAQNLEWVQALQDAGVDTTTLFFDAGSGPETVGHEYQLALDTPQGRQAMKAYVRFLREKTGAVYREGISDSW